MKQKITKKQWNELDGLNQKNFWIEMYGLAILDSDFSFRTIPTIGQMIEFLGDDLKQMEKRYSRWFVGKGCLEEELCDALWIACRYKLKNI